MTETVIFIVFLFDFFDLYYYIISIWNLWSKKFKKLHGKLKKNVNAYKDHKITNFENGRQKPLEYDNYRSYW